MKTDNKPCAEIIQSSLSVWVCQSWYWDTFPSFGSLISINHNNYKLFGIVHSIETGSIDPTRYPMAYKKTEAQLKSDHPELFEFLRTTFSCVAVGYTKQERLFHITPPEPPKIHAFVSVATTQEQKQFFSSPDYLHLLFGNAQHIINIDELLLSIIHNHIAQKFYDKKQFMLFMQNYSFLIGNDYRRVKQFIGRVQKT